MNQNGSWWQHTCRWHQQCTQWESSSGQKRMKLNPDQVCSLLDRCLQARYLNFKEKHDSTTASLVFTIVDTDKHGWNPREEATSHFTTNCVLQTRTDKDGLDIEVYRKAIHTDHYLLSDSHHPLHPHHPTERKLEVIWTSHRRGETISTNTKAGDKHTNIRGRRALKACSYPRWAFIKKAKTSKREQQIKGKSRPQWKTNILSSHMWLGFLWSFSNSKSMCFSSVAICWDRARFIRGPLLANITEELHTCSFTV